MDRVNRIAEHISACPGNGTPVQPHLPDDVVICCAVRTPLTKSKRGMLKDSFPEDLLKPLFEAVIQRSRIDPKLVEDVCIGNALQPGAGALSSRVAQVLGGLPVTSAMMVVNRQCSSGLQAVANIAAAIKAGQINIGIGGGVESMTHFDMTATLNPEKISQEVFDNEVAGNCLLPMGITSENVAAQFGVTREMQDRLAVESHRKAAAAQTGGLFDEEIVPVPVTVDGKKVLCSKDDGIRTSTSMETLAKLKPSFQKDGTTHAGNSSQVSDGASMVLLARRSEAERLGLPILARFVSFSVVGVPPKIMGIGPAVAIPDALGKAGIRSSDVGVFELNEAFASQAVYCVEKLQIPPHKLNPKGGAIALGHPLGATGARQIATLLPELRRTKSRYGVVSMCIGTGMGAAAVIENLV